MKSLVRSRGLARPGRLLLALGLGLSAFVGLVPAGSAAAAGCPNEALRTGAAGRLADCRAYEMVSPPDMNGNGVERAYAISPDGQSLAYGTVNTFGAEAPSSLTGKWIARREAQGWISSSLNVPTLSHVPSAYDEPVAMDFSADLSRVLLGTLYPVSPLDQSPNFGFFHSGNADIYRLSPTAAPEWVSHGPLLPDATGFDRAFGGASADLSRVFFETKEPLLPPAEGSTASNLYESDEGTTTVVNLDSAGNLISGGAAVGRGATFSASIFPSEYGNEGLNNQGQPSDPSAVSRDGRVVFFTAPLEGAMRQVYARIDGRRTEEASLCQAVACENEGAPEGAIFLSATPDGSAVVFFSAGALTEGAPLGGGIYRYEIGTESLSFLTPVDTAVGGFNGGGGVRHGGVLAVSEDGSYLYLCEAGGRLAVYHDGQVTPIAPVFCDATAGQNAETQSALGHEVTGGRPGQPAPGVEGIDAQGEPRVTPDGGFVFATTAGPASITTGEGEVTAGEKQVEEGEEEVMNGNTANGEALIGNGRGEIKNGERTIAEGEAFSGYENNGHSEVYLYQPGSARLRCLSCRPDGTPAQANAQLNRSTFDPASNAEVASPIANGIPVHNLAESGARAFFVSEEALVPGDVNEAQDVYEWELAGEGTCTSTSAGYSPASGGCVALVSSGRDPVGAVLEGSSASGEDVFFSSYESLVPIDTGTELQLYDARVEGGLPSQREVPSAGCGSQGECRGPGTTAPGSGTVGSTAISGAGNLGSGRACTTLSTRVAKLDRRSQSLRRQAERLRHRAPDRAKNFTLRARKLDKQGRSIAGHARRCMSNNRGMGK